MIRRLQPGDDGYATLLPPSKEARELDGAFRAEKARPLRERVVPWVNAGRVYCRIAFTAFGVSSGVRLQHEGHGAGDDRCGHARAAQAEVRPIEGDTVPGNRYCGLDVVQTSCSDRSATRSRRPARRDRAWPPVHRGVGPRELKAAIVSSRSIDGSHVGRRTDRQHPGRVARCGDSRRIACSPSGLLPAFPAAATTTIPASTARFRGQRQQIGVVGLVHP